MKKQLLVRCASVCCGALLSVGAVAEGFGLKSHVRFEIPDNVKTVQDAARYFIEPHQYSLLFSNKLAPESRQIAAQALEPPLPFGAILTVEEALLAVIGKKQRLVVDNSNNLIAFEWIEEDAQ